MQNGLILYAESIKRLLFSKSLNFSAKMHTSLSKSRKKKTSAVFLGILVEWLWINRARIKPAVVNGPLSCRQIKENTLKMLPSLFAAEPVLHRGWPACWPAGYRHCSCLCSGRPGSWFSSRTSSPFLSRSRRLSSATRSGSSAAAVDPRCRPFPPACRSLTYHSSSCVLRSGES